MTASRSATVVSRKESEANVHSCSTASSEPTKRLAPLAIPSDLQSGWSDAVWRFNTMKASGLHAIRWDRNLPDSALLTDDHHASLLENARRFLAVLIDDPRAEFAIEAHETAIARSITLLSIIEWTVGLGYRSLSEVTRADWEDFCGKLPFGLNFAKGLGAPREKRITDGRILEIFRVAQSLHLLYAYPTENGYLLLDGFEFDPFPAGNSPAELARRLGRSTGTTPIIPSAIALHCLDAAIQYIVYYSDDLINLHQQVTAIPPIKERSRRAPGEADRVVMKALLDHMKGKPVVPVRNGIVQRSEFARELGLHVTQLYKRDLPTLITEFEQARRDSARSEELVHRLHKVATAEPVKRDLCYPRKGNFDALGLPFVGKRGSAAPWPITTVYASRRRTEGNSLEKALATLWTSIFIVIDMFMSDRLGECLGLTVDCISEGVDGYYFNSTFHKQTNAQIGQANLRPCPEIVVKAVEVAERLGRDARAAVNTKRLFAFSNRLGKSVLNQSTVQKYVADFCRDVGAPKSEDGKEWRLAPHQLRRFLPSAWVWYFEIGPGLDALRQHLRHEDISMSLRYCLDETSDALATEEQRELTASILERSIYEGLDIVGPFGKRWQRIAARIQVEAVPPDEVGEIISEIIEQKDVLLYPQPWGYCTWWRNAAAYAKCLEPADRHGIRSRPEGPKSAQLCSGCINCMVTKVFAGFWADAQTRHEAIAAREDIPEMLKQAAAEGLQTANRMAAELSIKEEGKCRSDDPGA
ncbi:hypothetical protein [Nitratireductor sp. CH_MIT9313-5]|uniref:hypothetical protein n=1 Tax=Nitratireductor sp. CH_MIT9313-5 TaxID=3107764 RepID=UPI00300B4DA2